MSIRRIWTIWMRILNQKKIEIDPVLSQSALTRPVSLSGWCEVRFRRGNRMDFWWIGPGGDFQWIGPVGNLFTRAIVRLIPIELCVFRVNYEISWFTRQSASVLSWYELNHLESIRYVWRNQSFGFFWHPNTKCLLGILANVHSQASVFITIFMKCFIP